MCGIAGWLDHTADLKEKMDELQKMSESLKRRGPDEHGEYIRRHAALLHRRLSVIDPENGQQPMSTLYEGEKYTIVYNGELYNTARAAIQRYCSRRTATIKKRAPKSSTGFSRSRYMRRTRAGSFSVVTESASSRCFITPIPTGSCSAPRSRRSFTAG